MQPQTSTPVLPNAGAQTDPQLTPAGLADAQSQHLANAAASTPDTEAPQEQWDAFAAGAVPNVAGSVAVAAESQMADEARALASQEAAPADTTLAKLHQDADSAHSAPVAQDSQPTSDVA